ncbi:TPA: hypothetical protein ACGO62_001493 [Streptococcus suis]
MKSVFQNNIFQKNVSNLKNDSFDSTSKVYLIDTPNKAENIPSFQFDNIMRDYLSSQNINNSQVLKSVDSIIYSSKLDKIIFIEFKNGKIEVPRKLNNSPSKKNNQIRELEIEVAKLKLDAIRTKVKDSITVCTELFSKYPRYFRNNSVFILVYNDIKNTQIPDGLHNVAFNAFTQNMSQLAQSNFHLFNMGVLEGLCVEKVYTFNPTEFENFICNMI